MDDETLEISRKKLFDFIAEYFSDVRPIIQPESEKLFEERSDALNHDILENCKREKPIVETKENIELDWS